MSRDERVLSGAVRELGDLVVGTRRHGVEYAQRCVDSLFGEPRSRQFPPRPRGLHPAVAKQIREFVLEQAETLR